MPDLLSTSGPPRSAGSPPLPVPRDTPSPSPSGARTADVTRHAEALAERALQVAYRTALGVTRDPDLAADIAQEVAMKAIDHADRLRTPEAVDGWLHRIAVRTAIDEHRKARTRRTAEDGFGTHEPTAHHDDPSDTRPLLELLAVLPDRQRAAVTLRYVHDQSDRQIARALGCRTGTVRSLLSRAIATLRERQDLTTPTKADR